MNYGTKGLTITTAKDAEVRYLQVNLNNDAQRLSKMDAEEAERAFQKRKAAIKKRLRTPHQRSETKWEARKNVESHAGKKESSRTNLTSLRSESTNAEVVSNRREERMEKMLDCAKEICESLKEVCSVNLKKDSPVDKGKRDDPNLAIENKDRSRRTAEPCQHGERIIRSMSLRDEMKAAAPEMVAGTSRKAKKEERGEAAGPGVSKKPLNKSAVYQRGQSWSKTR